MIATDARRPAARTAEQLFDRLARRYDATNTALSLGLDARWRADTARALGLRGGERVLDVCAGTLELSRAVARAAPGVHVTSLDRAGGMLRIGAGRSTGEPVEPVQGCALALPFADASFDAATMAFGLRNLPDPARGLAEARRVLEPGGKLAILEFVHPTGALSRVCHEVGVRFVVPLVGGLVGADPAAYRYLARSIERFFDLEGVASLVERAGFRLLDGRLLAPRGPAALVLGEALP